jgi:hypothetical protein
MQRWEYFILENPAVGAYTINGVAAPGAGGGMPLPGNVGGLKITSTHEVFNTLGEKGWELIAEPQKKRWLFKRPKS